MSLGGSCKKCEFSGRSMTNATFTGGNFSGAELERASGLTQAQLNGACGDAGTTLPGGLTIPACR